MCQWNDLLSIPKLLRQRRGKDEQNVRLAKDSLVEGTGWKYTTQQTVWDSIQGDLHTLWVGLYTGAATVDNSTEVCQNTKSRAIIWPNYFTSGYTHPRVHSSIIYNCRDMKQPKCPSPGEWIKKIWYTYTMGYHLAIKKNKIFPFAAIWMNSEGIKWNESDRKRQILYDSTCMWNLENSTK